MLKFAFGWTLSQALFWLGHAASRVMGDKSAFLLYPIYNWLMTKSCAASDWSGAGVWQDCRDKQEKVTP